jgi:hypothetical protein
MKKVKSSGLSKAVSNLSLVLIYLNATCNVSKTQQSHFILPVLLVILQGNGLGKSNETNNHTHNLE